MRSIADAINDRGEDEQTLARSVHGEKLCNRRFNVIPIKWIGVRILYPWTGLAFEQHINPPLEVLPPGEPLPQTAQHSNLLLSTDKTNQRGALAANLPSRDELCPNGQKFEPPNPEGIVAMNSLSWFQVPS
jgi:hypothetical protein